MAKDASAEVSPEIAVVRAFKDAGTVLRDLAKLKRANYKKLDRAQSRAGITIGRSVVAQMRVGDTNPAHLPDELASAYPDDYIAMLAIDRYYEEFKGHFVRHADSEIGKIISTAIGPMGYVKVTSQAGNIVSHQGLGRAISGFQVEGFGQFQSADVETGSLWLMAQFNNYVTLEVPIAKATPGDITLEFRQQD